MSVHTGDDPTPRAGEGGGYRKTPTQLATDPAFTGTYGPVSPTVLARKLLTGLRPMAQPDPFTVASDVPTITAGTAATLTGRSVAVQTGEVTEVGSRGVWNGTFGRLPVGGFSGLDFYHTGTAVEIELFSGFTGGLPIWVFVNGQPIASTYDTSTLAATSGTSYFVKLTFGASATRRIEFFAMHGGAWYRVRGNLGDVFAPAPRRPVAVFVGDSFWAGSSASNYFDLPPFQVARRLGFECFTYNTSFGGSGYTNAGTGSIYGSAARVSATAAANPDLIVFQGSVNDDGNAASMQAAAASAFSAYAAACPNALQIVLGPQPSNATDTIAAARGTSAAGLRTAALAGSRVIGFFDEIGVASTGVYPAAWTSSTTYNTGDLATYKGSVWKANNGIGGTVSGAGETPGASRRWQLITWGYYGTGMVGATQSDGTRDTLLDSGGVHPTTAGQKNVFAPYTEKAIRDALAYYANTGTVLVA